MTMATIDLLEGTDIVMISPTSSTDDLTGIDDNFFRMAEASSISAGHLAEYARITLHADTISIIYDVSNEAYTLSWFNFLSAKFEELGGRFLSATLIERNGDIDYAYLADKLLEENPDSIAMALGSNDSALLCQQIRKKNNRVKLLLSTWAKDSHFLSNSGIAAEGVYFSDVDNSETLNDNYRNFVKKFVNRFGYEPGLAGASGYETLLFLKSALEGASFDNPVKRNLSEVKEFEGLLGDIFIDQFGDVRRNRHIVTVLNGEFVSLENQ
jgi:branched-chain amino acid transport system substrate-binding protein